MVSSMHNCLLWRKARYVVSRLRKNVYESHCYCYRRVSRNHVVGILTIHQTYDVNNPARHREFERV